MIFSRSVTETIASATLDVNHFQGRIAQKMKSGYASRVDLQDDRHEDDVDDHLSSGSRTHQTLPRTVSAPRFLRSAVTR